MQELGATREWYEVVASTQDRALELARAGAEEGTRVVARRQTAGRGRLDHRWESPGGGLHLSIVLASSDRPTGLLPVALGAMLAEALGRRSRSPLAVKWPNDVLAWAPGAPSRKLAGILVDRVCSPRLGSAAVAGIGVNVSVDPSLYPPELRPRIVGLSELVHPAPSLYEVERAVVQAALTSASRLRTADGRGEMLALCRRHLWGIGRRAWVDGRPVGRIVALDDDGALWVQEGAERVAIRAGDLRVEEAS